MARRTITYTVGFEGRDKGKTFYITEMPATQAEDWAVKAFLVLARGGQEIPDDLARAGLAGIATFGIKALAGAQFADIRPLMAEMMSCVQLIPDSNRPEFKRAILEGEIEEVKTLFELRQQVLNLHMGFLSAAGP